MVLMKIDEWRIVKCAERRFFMKKLIDHTLESAVDLRTGEILEDSLDAMKLTDEELEEVTGSQWPMMYPGMGYGGYGYGGYGGGYSQTTTFSTSSFYGGGGGYGYGGGYGPWM